MPVDIYHVDEHTACDVCKDGTDADYGFEFNLTERPHICSDCAISLVTELTNKLLLDNKVVLSYGLQRKHQVKGH
jgi:hypothetical protein